ncbi:MAG: response regulator [Alphaproteobacteria bacterium]|nr:response regulator [Alphaproteobacteria bacterium]
MCKAKILLIEDTDSVREVLTRQLEALGVSVTALSDGDRVKYELDQTHYDLVIADLHLPDCSGLDIARFARAKDCKIILLSGDAQAVSGHNAMLAQFDQILVKPVTLQVLKNILSRYGLIDSDQVAPIIKKRDQTIETEENAINLPALTEQMGHLDDIALQMLSRFPDMMRPLVLEILHLSETGETEKIVDLAHSLKGAARSAGALRLGNLVEKIQESAAHNLCDRDEIDKMLTEFTHVEMDIHQLCH